MVRNEASQHTKQESCLVEGSFGGHWSNTTSMELSQIQNKSHDLRKNPREVGGSAQHPALGNHGDVDDVESSRIGSFVARFSTIAIISFIIKYSGWPATGLVGGKNRNKTHRRNNNVQLLDSIGHYLVNRKTNSHNNTNTFIGAGFFTR